jgi:hypothetical protein
LIIQFDENRVYVRKGLEEGTLGIFNVYKVRRLETLLRKALANLRCHITGHPCGTDTVSKDTVCSCGACYTADRIHQVID